MASPLGNALRLVKPGEMVVSVSEIFDRIGGKLTADEKQQLLVALLSRRTDSVRPGDLITADLLNQVLVDIDDLGQRVTKLEGAAVIVKKTAITQLLPAGARRVGDLLHIIGRAFDAPDGNSVTVGGVSVAVTRGQDADSELIVKIPNLAVDPAGSQVAVWVSNLNGTDTKSVTVLPAVPTFPEGQVFASMTKPSAKVLTAPGEYIFEYGVRIIVNLAEQFTLKATTTAGWPCDIVDAAEAPVDPVLRAPISPAPDGTSFTVRVRVRIPDPAGATGAQLRLTVTSQRNAKLVGFSAGEDLKLGANGPPPEPITIQTDSVDATDQNTQIKPAFAAGVVKLPAGQGKYRIALNAKGFGSTDSYTRHIEAPADAKWTASFRLKSSLLDEQFTPQAGTMETFFVFCSAEAGAPAIDLVLRIAADADAKDKGHINQPLALL